MPVTLNGRPAKRSSRGPASWRHTTSWWSASTLMPRRSASRSSGQVELVVEIEKDTSGGSMLTEVNDDAAMPVSWPFTEAATATTPEGKAPKASRSVRGSRVELGGVDGGGLDGHADTTCWSGAGGGGGGRNGSAPANQRVVRRRVGVLGVEDEQAPGRHRRTELDQQRAQRVLDGQRVDVGRRRASAGSR